MAKKPNSARDLAAKYGYQTGGPAIPGNIDLHSRPVVHNADGSISTVRSITVGFGDKTYVLPTVIGDKVVSNKEAIDHFKKTGEHLGAFDTLPDAEGYSQRLHEAQAKEYEGRAKGGLAEKYGVEGYAKGGSPAVLKAYKPTVRNKIAELVGGDAPQGSLRRNFTDVVVGPAAGDADRMTLADLFGVGQLLTGQEGGRDITTPGQRLKGVGEIAMSLIPEASALKGAAKGAGKTAVKEAEKLAAKYAKPSVEPVVTQAGRMGLPLGGKEQMTVAHPSAFGPYATIKPRVSEDEVRVGYKPTAPMGEREVFSPEGLEGATVIPLYGDRSIAGKKITDINGMPVDVPLFGGPRYAEMNKALGSKAGWASEAAPIGALQSKIRSGLEKGRDVYGVYVPMSPRAADQTTMMTDALLQQVAQGDIKAADRSTFNDLIRQYLPDFTGVEDPKGAAEQLLGAQQYNRKNFTEAMDQAAFLKAGFPDVSATRIALTEPELRHAPAGSLGYSVVKFGPESLKKLDPTLVHPTYSTQMAGTPMGGFERSVPFDMIFNDLVEGRRAAQQPAGKDLRALELSKPSQKVTPEQIDLLMRYLEATRGKE